MKVVYADIILSIQRMTDRILMCNVDLWSVNTTSMSMTASHLRDIKSTIF